MIDLFFLNLIVFQTVKPIRSHVSFIHLFYVIYSSMSFYIKSERFLSSDHS